MSLGQGSPGLVSGLHVLSDKPKCSRVGPRYQVEVGDFTECLLVNRPELDGHCLWDATLLGSDTKRLEDYLDVVAQLFKNSRHHYCEQRALYLLHQCDYDIDKTMSLLQPWQPTEEEDDEDVRLAETEDQCSVCGDGGNLMLCDDESCPRVYHPYCVKLDQVPVGNWLCPHHFCVVCKQRLEPGHSVQCQHCPVSFCRTHIEPQAFRDPLHFQCRRHQHGVRNSTEYMDAIDGNIGLGVKVIPDSLPPPIPPSARSSLASEQDHTNPRPSKVQKTETQSCSSSSSSISEQAAGHDQHLNKENIDSSASVLASPAPQDFEGSAAAFLGEVLDILNKMQTPLTYVPYVGNQPVDLCRLYAEVTHRGGFSVVKKVEDWQAIAKSLGIDARDVVFQLKKYYMSILLPYEQKYFI